MKTEHFKDDSSDNEQSIPTEKPLILEKVTTKILKKNPTEIYIFEIYSTTSDGTLHIVTISNSENIDLQIRERSDDLKVVNKTFI